MRNFNKGKKQRIKNITIVVICFLMISISFINLINTKYNDLGKNVNDFAENSSINSVTYDEIKNFIDDNSDKGEMYAICINEPSQSYPSIIKSDAISNLKSEIINEKISRSEFQNNSTLKDDTKGYETCWIKDYMGREYIIIYKGSKRIVYIISLIVFIISIISLLIYLIVLFIEFFDKTFSVGDYWYHVKELDDLSKSKMLYDKMKYYYEKCVKIREGLKSEINDIADIIDVSNKNSNDNELNSKVMKLSRACEEFENINSNIGVNINDLNNDISKIKIALNKGKLDKNQFVDTAKKVTRIYSDCFKLDFQIEEELEDAYTLRYIILNNNKNFSQNINLDFLYKYKSQKLEEEIIPRIKQIINMELIPEHDREKILQQIFKSVEISIKNTDENFTDIISNIESTNYGLDNAHIEGQESYLKNIQAEIENIEKQIKSNSKVLSEVLDNVNLRNVNITSIVYNIKNEYESLNNKIQTSLININKKMYI